MNSKKKTSLSNNSDIRTSELHWRNILLELLLNSEYTLDDISKLLVCYVESLLLIINYNNPSFLSEIQCERLLTLHKKALINKNQQPK